MRATCPAHPSHLVLFIVPSMIHRPQVNKPTNHVLSQMIFKVHVLLDPTIQLHNLHSLLLFNLTYTSKNLNHIFHISL